MILCVDLFNSWSWNSKFMFGKSILEEGEKRQRPQRTNIGREEVSIVSIGDLRVIMLTRSQGGHNLASSASQHVLLGA